MRRCLSSLVNQTTPLHEILVVDGDSSDDTRKIVREFSDVTLIVNGKSHFGGASRNLGAQRAEGNTILFIDSDCYANRNLNSYHVEAYQHNLHLDGVQGAIRSARRTKFSRVIQSHFLTNYWIDNVKPNGMIKLNGAAGTNLSLDRELFLRNRFSEDLLSCEDIELFIKLRRMKGVVILLEPRAVVYHLHPNSLQELFAQRKWYGKGSVNFYRKYWHTTFKRDSILNTSKRYIKWDIRTLASALSTDHRKLCAGCQFGKCRISEPVLPKRNLPDVKYLRQVTCLAWAAGILGVRSNIDYDWGTD
ncbi:MAG: glycosyltransferase [Candidatus Bathyarchaeia archaeon]